MKHKFTNGFVDEYIEVMAEPIYIEFIKRTGETAIGFELFLKVFIDRLCQMN